MRREVFGANERVWSEKDWEQVNFNWSRLLLTWKNHAQQDCDILGCLQKLISKY